MPRNWLLLFLLCLMVLIACDFCWIQDCSDAEEEEYACSECNFQLTALTQAYNQKEWRDLSCCLSDQFTFYFNPADSIYVSFTFPDLQLDRDQELDILKNMFENAPSISLTLSGDRVMSYSGDPTGESKLLPRSYDLTVFLADGVGYRIGGECHFVVAPEDGTYKIVQWQDLSSSSASIIKEDGIRDVENDKSWGYVKWIFR
ncbi:MAG: hypothetical protein B6244_05415 [Candidatus Cloacimonetes bacterium 4572_55]|nr:MAG: hypothetical protein B6244_05415 [Candidatus Cloacimonetes bacterium 4572_55]